ncbi:MAG: glutamine synthetase [Deltaproteobacteria bacterium]|nr:glutamine synthetase [Deltaproteobacteria bacterium]
MNSGKGDDSLALAVAERIEKEGIKTVQIGFPDLQGVLRGKSIPASYFVERMKKGTKGVAFCVVALGWDVQCGIVEGLEFSSWANGFPDMVAVPDLTTFEVLPWQASTAFVLCDLATEHGQPIPFAPRTVLKGVLREAAEDGYSVVTASELEFYLLQPDGRTPVYDGIHCYEIQAGYAVEFVLGEIREKMAQIGITIEASNTEYGPAQLEVNLKYSNALEQADKTMLFKAGVKEIARQHGMRATFMSKIWQGQSGNGYHVHQSLWDAGSGENLFENGHEGMSDTMAHYMAGLINSFRTMYVLGAWTVNAYKRIAPYSYAPTRLNWGIDNRTTALRAVLAGKGTRIENRMSAAEANPYLVFAANIAAGLDGVRRKLALPDQIIGDGYRPGAGEPIPTSLKEATDLFSESEVARRYFGSDFVNTFAAVSRHEADQFRRVVHEWERERYLDMV